MFGGGQGVGPCAMMDSVGLFTVKSIEQHYVNERGLAAKAINYPEQNYNSKGN